MFTLLTCLKIDLERGAVSHKEFQTFIKGLLIIIIFHYFIVARYHELYHLRKKNFAILRMLDSN